MYGMRETAACNHPQAQSTPCSILLSPECLMPLNLGAERKHAGPPCTACGGRPLVITPRLRVHRTVQLSSKCIMPVNVVGRELADPKTHAQHAGGAVIHPQVQSAPQTFFSDFWCLSTWDTDRKRAWTPMHCMWRQTCKSSRACPEPHAQHVGDSFLPLSSS